MQLPPGTVDPLFECELALGLHMTLAELRHGRGTPMSAKELAVEWPAFFRFKERERRRAEEKAEMDRLVKSPGGRR